MIPAPLPPSFSLPLNFPPPFLPPQLEIFKHFVDKGYTVNTVQDSFRRQKVPHLRVRWMRKVFDVTSGIKQLTSKIPLEDVDPKSFCCNTFWMKRLDASLNLHTGDLTTTVYKRKTPSVRVRGGRIRGPPSKLKKWEKIHGRNLTHEALVKAVVAKRLKEKQQKEGAGASAATEKAPLPANELIPRT